MGDSFTAELEAMSGGNAPTAAWHGWTAEVRAKISEAISIYDAGARISKQGLLRWLAERYPEHQITSSQLDKFAVQSLGRRSWCRK